MAEEIRGHETSDISARAASWFGLALVLSVTVTGLLVWQMERYLDPAGPSRPHQPGTVDPAFQPPSPALQANPAEDLRALRTEEGRLLQRYSWVDRKAGIIRLPLQRARDLMLLRGLPQTGTTMPLPGPFTVVPASPPQGGTP